MILAVGQTASIAVGSEVRFTSKPRRYSRSTSASFGFSSDEGSDFQCRREGRKSWSRCRSPVTFQVGEGIHTFRVRLQASSPPAVWRWTVDRTPPRPTAIPVPRSAFQRHRWFTVAWRGVDGLSGVRTFDLRSVISSYEGATRRHALWLKGTQSTGTSLRGRPGFTYCFSGRTRDRAGNLSAFSQPATCTAIPVDDSAMVHRGPWAKRRRPGSYLGTVSGASKRGATLSLPAVRAARLALVATTCQRCGRLKAYWKGSLVKRVDLHSPRTRKRRFILLAARRKARVGSVRLVVTSRRKPVRIEGLAVSAR
jgi:hypothetical protein